MRARITPLGNWNAFNMMASNLTKDLQEARLNSLRLWGLKAEAIAKKHIASQDLAKGFWLPLAAYTIRKKMQEGYPLTTLLETGTYLGAITSWATVDTAYVGIRTRQRASHDLTEELADVARINEFGSISLNIPARPLWQPTFTEAMSWHVVNNQPNIHFMNIVRRKYSF